MYVCTNIPEEVVLLEEGLKAWALHGSVEEAVACA